MRRMLLAALLVLVFGAVACGGDDDDAADTASADETAGESGDDSSETTAGDASPTDVDVCGLVTVEEVSAWVGHDVTAEPKNDASGQYGVCEWRTPDVSGWVSRLTVGPADHYELLKRQDAEPLDGVGDEAWISPVISSVGSPTFDIGVKTGDYHVLIFFSDTDDTEKGAEMAAAVVDAL